MNNCLDISDQLLLKYGDQQIKQIQYCKRPIHNCESFGSLYHFAQKIEIEQGPTLLLHNVNNKVKGVILEKYYDESFEIFQTYKSEQLRSGIKLKELYNICKGKKNGYNLLKNNCMDALNRNISYINKKLNNKQQSQQKVSLKDKLIKFTMGVMCISGSCVLTALFLLTPFQPYYIIGATVLIATGIVQISNSLNDNIYKLLFYCIYKLLINYYDFYLQYSQKQQMSKTIVELNLYFNYCQQIIQIAKQIIYFE